MGSDTTQTLGSASSSLEVHHLSCSSTRVPVFTRARATRRAAGVVAAAMGEDKKPDEDDTSSNPPPLDADDIALLKTYVRPSCAFASWRHPRRRSLRTPAAQTTRCESKHGDSERLIARGPPSVLAGCPLLPSLLPLAESAACMPLLRAL